MKLTKNRLFAAVLALGLPISAFAQSNLSYVPPPVAPTGVSTPVNAPVAAKDEPAVIPPAVASSINPAVPAPATQTIDVALPDAPKQNAANTSDLKPAGPAIATTTSKAQAKGPTSTKSKPASTKVSKAADPFAGLVVTPVSDTQLNRFVFPEPVANIFFPEGAPLPECPADAAPMDPCKPVFLNGKRMMLLQMRAGAQGPVQMLVLLKSGRMDTMYLMPSPGPGAIIRIDGAEDGASDTRLAEGRSAAGTGGLDGVTGMGASEQHVELLSRIARGDIPAGFEPVGADGGLVRFELFDVIPQATWDNGAGLRAYLFQVKAHDKNPVALSPGLFRRPNIKAVALDRETITNSEPAMLFVLEAMPTENN